MAVATVEGPSGGESGSGRASEVRVGDAQKKRNMNLFHTEMNHTNLQP